MLRVTLSVKQEDLHLAASAAHMFISSKKENFLEVKLGEGYFVFNVSKKYDMYGPYIYVVRVK